MNILEFALQMEQEASDFYSDLARRVADKGPQRIFCDLAEDHEERRRFIEKLGLEAGSGSGLADQELGVKNSPWHHLPPGTVLGSTCDDEAAYRLALQLEEEEAHCFEDLLDRSPSQAARRLLKRISAEEERRLESLREIYDFVNAPNQYLAWGEFSNLDEFHQFGRDVD